MTEAARLLLSGSARHLTAKTESRLDEDGNLIVDVKELVGSISDDSFPCTLSEDGTQLTATWIIVYIDENDVKQYAKHEGTINKDDCEIGFYIDTDFDCKNPNEEEEIEGDLDPCFGQIIGCNKLPEKTDGGNLMYGADAISGQNAIDRAGAPITDCNKIYAVISVDACEGTDNEGMWAAIYRPAGEDFGLKIGFSPSTGDGDTEDSLSILIFAIPKILVKSNWNLVS